MISTSPLRYPGGKARFTDFIRRAIVVSGEEPTLFVEPFCGGAGAALALLEADHVERIALNDVDPLVSSFWRIVFGKSRATRHDINWLVGKVEAAEISVEEWRRQKALIPSTTREAAWKCLFLNRTSFNGILHQAGPIGGWQQLNRKLDVRFNREKLVKRLNDLYDLRDRVDRVGGANWKQFCSYYRSSSAAYVYLDPPYYHRAEQLYGYLFDAKTHASMRDYLLAYQTPWMLSYDDAVEVRNLYSGRKEIDGRVIDQTYSANPIGGSSHVGRELFFSNRALPVVKQSKNEPHVGLTVLGHLSAIAAPKEGPIRTPMPRMAAST